MKRSWRRKRASISACSQWTTRRREPWPLSTFARTRLSQLYDAVIIPALTMAEQDRHKGALDPTREEFLFMSIKEMLVEFSERTLKSDGECRSRQRAPGKNPAVSAGRVLCVPANDEADEITAAMLAQLLEQAGHAAHFVFPGCFPAHTHRADGPGGERYCSAFRLYLRSRLPAPEP